MSNLKPQLVEIHDPLTRQPVRVYQSTFNCGTASCHLCAQQFYSNIAQLGHGFRYVEALSMDDAGRITRKYSKKIHGDLEYLQDMLSKKGNAIVMRWGKNSRQWRSSILRKAYPTIHPSRSSALQLYSKADPSRMIGLHQSLLVPWLNLETLRDDSHKLLALLHARTKFAPEKWVAFDNEQIYAYWKLGGYHTKFADCGVTLHGKSYGEVVGLNKDQVHRMDIIAFPRGCLVLEAQSTIMKFLRKVIEAILEGSGPDISSDKWTTLVDTKFRGSTDNLAWSNFSGQQYIAPIFEIDRLLEVARASYRDSEDHLWLLQTDPSYFQYRIEEYKITKFFGDSYPHLLCTRALISWRYSCYIFEELLYLKQQSLIVEGGINLGEPLPKEYDIALALLELLVQNILSEYIMFLGALLPSLASFRDYYTTSLENGFLTSLLDTNKIKSMEDLFKNDPLFWCLLKLSRGPEHKNSPNTAMLFTLLTDWFDDASYQAKKKLEPQLLEDLSQLASLHDILASIRQNRPLFQRITVSNARLAGKERPAWRGMAECMPEDDDEEQMKHMGDLLKRFQESPFPKSKKDNLWIEKAEKSHETSKAFWAEFRNNIRKKLPYFPHMNEDDIEKELAILSLDSTPEHLAMLRAQRGDILHKKQEIQTPVPSIDSDSALTHVKHSEPQSFNVTIRPKVKIKTRSEELASVALVTPNAPREEMETTSIPSRTIVRIKSSNLAILRRLFPASVEEFNAKPLDWKIFVAALHDAGLSAAESGGSAVTFLDAVNGGRIVFHRPHPVAKVDQVILQAWGKRLTRWFRWERESFVTE